MTDLALYLKSVLFGLVEGITEFLPISSTGHMILLDALTDLSSDQVFTNAFQVMIQLGAIVAVICLFWARLCPLTGPRDTRPAKWLLWAKIVAAFIPAAILGVMFGEVLEVKLFTPRVVALTLIGYGVLLIVLERYFLASHQPRVTDTGAIAWTQALAIGAFQCLAMVPGTSRSAVTIIGALLLGLSRPVAAEFSFYLAIPTLTGAAVYSASQHSLAFTASEWIALGIGFAVSFLAAAVVIRLFMGYIQRRSFTPFGWYRIALGILVLALL